MGEFEIGIRIAELEQQLFMQQKQIEKIQEYLNTSQGEDNKNDRSR